MKTSSLLAILLAVPGVNGFSTISSSSTTTTSRNNFLMERKRRQVIIVGRPTAASAPFSSLQVASSTQETAPTTTTTTDSKKDKAKQRLQELKKQGGSFTFNTPIGALNPFAIYYGLTSIFLGIPWFFALKTYQLLFWMTGGRIDRKRRIPVLLSHFWGVSLMRFTRSYPEIENEHILADFYKKKQAAMFVANHCSWMDIPFLGATVGWRNYKIVSKKELSKIPILGTAIITGGNILVDRTDRKSQLKTLKDGIAYLKDNTHLCTFPEGTRSRTGRLIDFKNGSFKMAHKAGAPVIPISIVNSQKVMPLGWMFANRASHGIAKVIVHEPVESIGRTEEELAAEVRRRMISGLPDYQKPLLETEV